MCVESIESVLKDTSRSDDEVYALITEMLESLKERLPQMSDQELKDGEDDLRRLSELTRKHRPNVMERIRQKVVADRAHCCGDHAPKKDCCQSGEGCGCHD